MFGCYKQQLVVLSSFVDAYLLIHHLRSAKEQSVLNQLAEYSATCKPPCQCWRVELRNINSIQVTIWILYKETLSLEDSTCNRTILYSLRNPTWQITTTCSQES